MNNTNTELKKRRDSDCHAASVINNQEKLNHLFFLVPIALFA